ncbi:TPA: hypothetical protein ACH3X2_013300 [Trebouxia sp. C0005]
MVPTFLTAEVAQAAQCGQLARICKWLNEGGPINARDVFQCSLLHLATGAGQVIVVQELVKRGADLDERMPDLQYAQGKTALHRACEEGHVEIVEILVDAGANTQLCAASCSAQKQAKPGRRSRESLSQRHSLTGVPSLAQVRSASELCKNTTVRLALERPSWSPQTHALWPAKFKAVVQLLLFLLTSHKRNNKENESVTQYCPFSSFSLSRRTTKATMKAIESAQNSSSLHLDWDTLQQVICRLAYPVSQWYDSPQEVVAETADKGSHTRRKRRP